MVCSSASWSQESSDDLVIEEILVTALRREQLAQDIPISLFAVSGESLARSGIDSLQGLGDIAAGVEIVSASPGTVQLAVRGITNLAPGQLDTTAAIGFYIDETPLSSFTPTELPEAALWDVERVEILRGPQGTLFGESSMGGTIRVITRKPDPQKFDGWVSGQFVNVSKGGSGFQVRGMANIPLIENELALRLNIGESNQPGWIDVPDLGLEDVNELDQTDIRIALGWTPSERLNLNFSYMNKDMDLDSAFEATSQGLFDPQSAVPPGAAAPTATLQPQHNSYDLFNLTVAYDFESASLVSATSYFDLERELLGDLSPFTISFFGFPAVVFNKGSYPVDSFTQELRLVSTGDRVLDWTAGVFYKQAERGGFQLVTIDIDIPDFQVTDQLHQLFDVSIDSYAIFGEVDYELSDRWSVQAGGRFYSDDRTVSTFNPVGSIFFPVVAGTVITADDSDSDFAPSLGVKRSGENSLFFARVAKGFRAGGINDNLPFAPDEIPPIYGPEELWSFELGLKNQLSEGRIQFNAYAYFNDWSDLQVTLTESANGAFLYTVNAGDAEAIGGELELLAQATPDLSLSINLSLIDAETTEDVIGFDGEVVLPKGSEIPFVSDLTLGASIDYRRSISGQLEGAMHARYSHRSANFSDSVNTPALENDDYNQVYLRAGLEAQS